MTRVGRGCSITFSLKQERKVLPTSQRRIDTQRLHAGYTSGNGEPRNILTVQSITPRYVTGEQMRVLSDLKGGGYFYTRLQNPTNDRVAAKTYVLEGGAAAMPTSSG